MSASPRSVPLLVTALVAIAVLSRLGPRSLLVLATDGPLIFAVLMAAGGFGSLLTRPLPVPRLARLMLSLCLGLGVLSLATLAFGLTGWLNRPLAWALIAAGGLIALARLRPRREAPDQGPPTRKPADPSRAGRPRAHPQRAADAAHSTEAPGSDAGPSGVVLVSADLALAVALGCSLGVLLFAATLAPGSVWAIEARGYDALEYHLQAPREYYEAGRVHVLPHNVYAQFPQQMEMLYLLLMHLRGGPWAAAIACQLLHAACAILAVGTLALWLPGRWPRRAALLLAGTTPWLVVTGSLAYVEAGLVLFAVQAAGLLIGALRARSAGWETALLSGLCAGLAAGCKYTAVALVAAPLVAGWLLVPMAWSRRVRLAGVALAGVVVAFGPWMLRNAAWTGNPVYPLAWSLFDGRGLSPEQHRQWTRAHSLPDATPRQRMAIAARELLGTLEGWRAFRPSLFGPAVWMLAAVGLLAVRDRIAALLGGWLLAALLIWMFATHIPGRFAIPAIVPAVWLAGRGFAHAIDGGAVRLRVALLTAIAVLGGGMNLLTVGQLVQTEQAHWRRLGLDLAQLVDATPAFQAAHPASSLPAGASVWIVGDAAVFYVRSPMHYTVVFSRDPWIEYCQVHRDDPAACVQWLRGRDVDFVAFAWGEIERLRATYGFPALVSPGWVAALERAGLSHLGEVGTWDLYGL